METELINIQKYDWAGDIYNWDELCDVIFKDTGEYPDKHYANKHLSVIDNVIQEE